MISEHVLFKYTYLALEKELSVDNRFLSKGWVLSYPS